MCGVTQATRVATARAVEKAVPEARVDQMQGRWLLCWHRAAICWGTASRVGAWASHDPQERQTESSCATQGRG